MKLSKPKNITWIIAVVLGIISLVLWFAVPASPLYAWLAALVGLGLLALANAIKGL